MVLASSCTKDEYGTYDFFTNTVTYVADQDRASQIMGIIYSDIYFSSQSSYTGTLSQTVNLAVNDFTTHIEKLDTESIEKLLKFGENVKIRLHSMNPFGTWMTYVITPDGLNALEE